MISDHFRPGDAINADDIMLLITEHSAPYSAVQITNEHDRIMAIKAERIAFLEKQRDDYFGEIERAREIITRMHLEKEVAEFARDSAETLLDDIYCSTAGHGDVAAIINRMIFDWRRKQHDRQSASAGEQEG